MYIDKKHHSVSFLLLLFIEFAGYRSMVLKKTSPRIEKKTSNLVSPPLPSSHALSNFARMLHIRTLSTRTVFRG